MKTRHTYRIAWATLMVATLGLLLFVGCNPSAPPAATPAQSVAATPAKFVGNAACQECHEKEFREHAASRHNFTLTVVDEAHLKERVPPVGRIPDTPYEIKKEGEKFFFVHKDTPQKKHELHLALGSGKSGMTYVSFTGDKSLAEIRMSYFPQRRKWYITPGQEQVADNDVSRPFDGEIAQKCILCHASATSETSIRPEDKHMGVSCESCHGPGSTHIEAARPKGATDFKIERMKQWDATKINDLCGKCHRAPEQVESSGVAIAQTQRFQAYGLMQSPCYQKSGQALSCVTCHNPHQNAETDERYYEKACLNCHGGAAPDAPKVTFKVVVCPVNPKEKCVGCHMPKRKVFPLSKVDISMADHLIWAYGKKKK